MNYPVVVFTCDAWKSHDSMRFKGVFTSLTQLRKGIKQLLDNDEVDYSDGGSLDISKCCSSYDFDNNFDGLYLEEITLNEIV